MSNCAARHSLIRQLFIPILTTTTAGSNGPKWNEIVAEELGLELLNYAVGGATADNSIVQGYAGVDLSIPVSSAKDQIERFFATDAPRPDDVFVHWVGLNDILLNTSVTGQQISGRIEKNIDRLHQSGMSKEKDLLILVMPLTDFPRC